MSYETRAYDNEHGNPVVVIVVEGTHDVSRIVHGGPDFLDNDPVVPDA